MNRGMANRCEQLLRFPFRLSEAVNGYPSAIFVDRLHRRREDGWTVTDVIELGDDG
jgi:hypothetical protein